nr:hypothetical protein [Pandoraea bronchicola]
MRRLSSESRAIYTRRETMQELQNVVSTAFAKIVASGAIEKAIEKKLEETITSAIDNEIRGYSDFGRAISEGIKKSMHVDFDTLDIPGYNDLILKILRQKLEANMSNALTAGIDEQMTELLAPPPAEISLEDLVETFKRDEMGHGSALSDSITLIVEQDRDYSTMQFTMVYLDRSAGMNKNACSYRIHLCDGKVLSMSIDRKDAEKTLFIGPLYRFSRRLFQMYAAGTKLIVGDDHEDIDRYYPDYHD